MQVVILAGGHGTRLMERTTSYPKPLVPIGDRPIIWHIMKYFSHFGFNQFVLCLGYKSEIIKDYFYHYHLKNSDLTIKLGENPSYHFHNYKGNPWEITLVDTGLHTGTGGRIKKVAPYLDIDAGPFFLTYCDGLYNINLAEILSYHHYHKKQITVTAVPYPERFGLLDLTESNQVKQFAEKPEQNGKFLNGGLFVCEHDFLKIVESDDTMLERAPMERMASQGELMAFKHHGFWHCMDTLKDQQNLQELWDKDTAPWKVWTERDEGHY